MKMTVVGLVLTLGVAGLLLPLLVETPKVAKPSTSTTEAQLAQPCPIEAGSGAGPPRQSRAERD